MRTICGRSVFKSYITPKRKGKQNARGREGQGRNRRRDGEGLPHPSAPVQGGDEGNKIPSLPLSEASTGAWRAISTSHLKKGPMARGQGGVREFYLVVDVPPLNMFT